MKRITATEQSAMQRRQFADARAITDIVETCRPVLAGQGPQLQGAALADMTAMWLAGHPAGVRDQVLRQFVEFVERLVPVNVKMMGSPE